MYPCTNSALCADPVLFSALYANPRRAEGSTLVESGRPRPEPSPTAVTRSDAEEVIRLLHEGAEPEPEPEPARAAGGSMAQDQLVRLLTTSQPKVSTIIDCSTCMFVATLSLNTFQPS